MKRRQRRPVLDVSNEQSDSSRARWQNKYQQIAVDHPEQNGAQINPLASLLGQYNSDSESEDTKPDSNKLNDKVNDFFKEIQMIAPEKDVVKSSETRIPTRRIEAVDRETSGCSWQECFDETTGYPYYWHIETNEVTWEMPNEMKILRDKSNDSNKNVVPTATLHHQVQQWANFLPNRYPELQTNIPEGMIPKEVVARNRNRQVGIRKGVQDAETISQAPKKPGPKDEDSDDEKIEMITSFGNDESESETSENDSSPKADQKTQKSGTSLPAEKNSEPKEEDSLSIGPLLPPGIIPMIHGPENVSADMRRLENETYIAEETKEIIKSEEIDEEDILKRLKNQAKLLQSLGGEVPESVETLIKNNNDKQDLEDDGETEERGEEDDIILRIEKQMPVDHLVNRIQDKEIKIKKIGVEKKGDDIKKQQSQFKISLVAGYSDDSETEEEVSPKKINPQPLFPISDYIGKEHSNTGSRDSVAIDQGNSIDNIDAKEEESQSLVEGNSRGNENDCTRDSNGLDSQENEENRENKTTNETSSKYSFLENLEMPAKGFKRKKRIAFDVVPNKPLRPQTESSLTSSSKTDLSSTNFPGSSSQDEPERHGFGFRKEQDSESTESTENMASDLEKHQRGINTERDSSSQSKKPIINFVKGETEGEEKPTKQCAEFKKPSLDDEDTKRLKELTEIILEKVKFLSEGSQNLSAIQIMATQIQTLVAAWEAGDLRESYLSEWVNGTERELGRLEEAAAPPGWDCHWDRSHKRYYYRNSVNGDAQWTYPDSDVVGGTEEMDLCTTPPPPEDEELLIIEEKPQDESEMKLKESKSSAMTIVSDNKIVQITKDEYKSIEAPPPPQISSPSPPPPPRIFAEDLKKGKKRRASNGERSLELKKEKLESDAKESVDPPPLPPTPPKNTSQPPLPPNPPVIPNPPNSEPLPPGVDPKDMPYSLQTVTSMEPSVVYATGATQQTNPIYAATIGDRGGLALPIIDHRSAIIQGQLMHYPTYQHLHNQAMIAAAGSLGGQEAVQFMIADYAQVYANTQVIAKPPVKSQTDHSLGSALDSFYNDIASIEKTNAEQESTSQEFDSQLSASISEANSTPPPIIAVTSNPVVNIPVSETEEKASDSNAGKEKKRKKAKIGIGKKHKEMSTMVAKWQKAQQDFDDSE